MRNTISFDWAIKRLLRNKANFEILEGFLTELFGEEIIIDGLLESESNMQDATDKTTRVDLLVKNSKGELLIIEVQSRYKHDYLMRILYGVAKLIVDNMVKGMEYNMVKKVISINIVYFDLGFGKDYVYHGTTSYVGLHNNDVLQLSQQEQLIFKAEKIERIYPEFYIIKVDNFDTSAKNTLDEWIYFLKTEEINKDTKAKGLQAAKKQIDLMRLDKQAMAEYERDEALLRDYASDMSTNFLAGKIEGEANKEKYADEKAREEVKKEKLENAKNCLKNGLSIELTSKITGLTEDEIRNITL